MRSFSCYLLSLFSLILRDDSCSPQDPGIEDTYRKQLRYKEKTFLLEVFDTAGREGAVEIDAYTLRTTPHLAHASQHASTPAPHIRIDTLRTSFLSPDSCGSDDSGAEDEYGAAGLQGLFVRIVCV